MTVKRRKYVNVLGKHYPTWWRKLKSGYVENVYSNYVGHETLELSADMESLTCIPQNNEGDIEIISRVSINALGRIGSGLRRDVMYELKDGIENGRIEFAWEPTLPSQARK